MKKQSIYICAVIVLAMAQLQSAHALGLAVSRQKTDVGMPSPQLAYTSMFNRLVDRMKGFIILDTALADDRIFNYRVSFECSNIMTQKDFGYSNLSYNINCLTMANTFGFGFFRTSSVRLWAGPQFALAYEYKNRNNTVFDPVIYSKIGSVVGLNLHAGKDMTFIFEMGFRTGFGFDISKSLSNTLVESKVEPIASVRLIFRSWDLLSSSRG